MAKRKLPSESATAIALEHASPVVRALYSTLDKDERITFQNRAKYMIKANSRPLCEVAIHAFTLIRDSDPHMSYEQIAEELGVSIEAVRQIHDRAIKKIAVKLIELGYSEDDVKGV